MRIALGVILLCFTAILGAFTEPSPYVPLTTPIAADSLIYVAHELEAKFSVLGDQVEDMAGILRRAGVSEDSAGAYAGYFIRYATEADVDPILLAAVAYEESRFIPWAYNPNDPSWGMGQVMPRYWRTAFVKECGVEATPTTLVRPRIGICYSAHILGHNLRMQGSTRLGVARYNGFGPAAARYAGRVLHHRERLLGGTI